jgi:hypothetical protein
MQTLKEQSFGPITPTMPLLPSWTSLQLQGGGGAVVGREEEGGGGAVVGREEEGGEGEGEDRSELLDALIHRVCASSGLPA